MRVSAPSSGEDSPLLSKTLDAVRDSFKDFSKEGKEAAETLEKVDKSSQKASDSVDDLEGSTVKVVGTFTILESLLGKLRGVIPSEHIQRFNNLLLQNAVMTGRSFRQNEQWYNSLKKTADSLRITRESMLDLNLALKQNYITWGMNEKQVKSFANYMRSAFGPNFQEGVATTLQLMQAKPQFAGMYTSSAALKANRGLAFAQIMSGGGGMESLTSMKQLMAPSSIPMFETMRSHYQFVEEAEVQQAQWREKLYEKIRSTATASESSAQTLFTLNMTINALATAVEAYMAYSMGKQLIGGLGGALKGAGGWLGKLGGIGTGVVGGKVAGSALGGVATAVEKNLGVGAIEVLGGASKVGGATSVVGEGASAAGGLGMLGWLGPAAIAVGGGVGLWKGRKDQKLRYKEMLENLWALGITPGSMNKMGYSPTAYESLTDQLWIAAQQKGMAGVPILGFLSNVATLGWLGRRGAKAEKKAEDIIQNILAYMEGEELFPSPSGGAGGGEAGGATGTGGQKPTVDPNLTFRNAQKPDVFMRGKRLATIEPTLLALRDMYKQELLPLWERGRSYQENIMRYIEAGGFELGAQVPHYQEITRNLLMERDSTERWLKVYEKLAGKNAEQLEDVRALRQRLEEISIEVKTIAKDWMEIEWTKAVNPLEFSTQRTENWLSRLRAVGGDMEKILGHEDTLIKNQWELAKAYKFRADNWNTLFNDTWEQRQQNILAGEMAYTKMIELQMQKITDIYERPNQLLDLHKSRVDALTSAYQEMGAPMGVMMQLGMQNVTLSQQSLQNARDQAEAIRQQVGEYSPQYWDAMKNVNAAWSNTVSLLHSVRRSYMDLFRELELGTPGMSYALAPSGKPAFGQTMGSAYYQGRGIPFLGQYDPLARSGGSWGTYEQVNAWKFGMMNQMGMNQDPRLLGLEQGMFARPMRRATNIQGAFNVGGQQVGVIEIRVDDPDKLAQTINQAQFRTATHVQYGGR